MRISVVATSCCRSWALGRCLESLSHQLRPADEVVTVLKTCGDESETLVEEFGKVLPVRLVLQSSGGRCADAYELGYGNASGDLQRAYWGATAGGYRPQVFPEVGRVRVLTPP